jgi:hypothetical protein
MVAEIVLKRNMGDYIIRSVARSGEIPHGNGKPLALVSPNVGRRRQKKKVSPVLGRSTLRPLTSNVPYSPCRVTISSLCTQWDIYGVMRSWNERGRPKHTVDPKTYLGGGQNRYAVRSDAQGSWKKPSVTEECANDKRPKSPWEDPQPVNNRIFAKMRLFVSLFYCYYYYFFLFSFGNAFFRGPHA